MIEIQLSQVTVRRKRVFLKSEKQQYKAKQMAGRGGHTISPGSAEAGESLNSRPACVVGCFYTFFALFSLEIRHPDPK